MRFSAALLALVGAAVPALVSAAPVGDREGPASPRRPDTYGEFVKVHIQEHITSLCAGMTYAADTADLDEARTDAFFTAISALAPLGDNQYQSAEEWVRSVAGHAYHILTRLLGRTRMNVSSLRRWEQKLNGLDEAVQNLAMLPPDNPMARHLDALATLLAGAEQYADAYRRSHDPSNLDADVAEVRQLLQTIETHRDAAVIYFDTSVPHELDDIRSLEGQDVSGEPQDAHQEVLSAYFDPQIDCDGSPEVIDP